MSEKKIFTLQKEERLNSKIIIEKLFSGGSKRRRMAPYNFSAYQRSEKEVQKSCKKKQSKKTDKGSIQKKQIHIERCT